MEEVLLASAKGPSARGHADGSGQERGFMGPEYIAGSGNPKDPASYEGTACSRLALGYLQAISVTTVPQGREEQGPAVCFANFQKKKKKSHKPSLKQFLNDLVSLLPSRRRLPGPTRVATTGASGAIDREGNGGAGTAAFREDRYIPMVKGAHYVFADRKVSNIRAICTNTLPP